MVNASDTQVGSPTGETSCVSRLLRTVMPSRTNRRQSKVRKARRGAKRRMQRLGNRMANAHGILPAQPATLVMTSAEVNWKSLCGETIREHENAPSVIVNATLIKVTVETAVRIVYTVRTKEQPMLNHDSLIFAVCESKSRRKIPSRQVHVPIR